VARRELRPRVNWKIASDTFWEAYHIKVLHRQNVAPLFVKNLALFEPFGRNHRYVGIRRSIEDLRAVPESEWELLPHATILMNLFPNTILVMQSDHLECFRLFPDAEQANACRVQVTVLAPAETAEDPRWQHITALLIGVVEQDFAIGETIQRSFDSGVLERVVYGRYENALEHFHRSVREALGA
jgi:phenylpropionate dioxygenase-like ring-hydroxylating dioxygenase large terminal subunit